MELKQIFLPDSNPENIYSTYENQLMPRIFFDSEKAKEIFETNKNSISRIVEAEIKNYINDDDLCSDSENMFPKRSVLTGEWYISSICFEDEMLSVFSALLGTDMGFKDDYLGLEIHLKYKSDTNEFVLYGIDSSSI